MSEKLEKGGNIDQRERNTLWEDLVSTSDITSKNTWDILSHTLISQLDDHLNTFQDREIREIMTIIFKTQIHSEFFNEYLEEYWTDESKDWFADILTNRNNSYKKEFIILWHRLQLAQDLIQRINKSINSSNILKYYEFLHMGVEK